MTRLNCTIGGFLAGWLVTVAFLGCAVPVDKPDDGEPVKPGITAAARKAMHEDYPAGIARVASEVVEKAGEFKSYGEVFDYTHKRTQEERDTAFGRFTDALDAVLKPHEGKYDPELTRQAFREAAEGFSTP